MKLNEKDTIGYVIYFFKDILLLLFFGIEIDENRVLNFSGNILLLFFKEGFSPTFFLVIKIYVHRFIRLPKWFFFIFFIWGQKLNLFFCAWDF